MWTYTITEFMGISNFMLFVNKQTFDAPSNAGVQCIYACNVDISLTKTCKQLTIIMETQAPVLGGGVRFQSMPLLLNTD